MLPNIVIVGVYKSALQFIIIVNALLTLLGCVALQVRCIEKSFGLMLSSLARDRLPKQKKMTFHLVQGHC